MAPHRECCEFYKAVFQNIPLPALLIDRKSLNVVCHNKSLEFELGYAENEWQPANIDEILANEESKHVIRTLASSDVAVFKQQSVNFDVIGKLSISNVSSWKGNIVAIDEFTLMVTGVLTAHDIDEKNPVCSIHETTTFLDKFPLSQHTLVDLLENAAIGVNCTSADGTCVYANKHLLNLLGYEAHEYIGKKTSSFVIVDETNEAALSDAYTRIRRGETVFNIRSKFRAKNGDVKFIVADSCGNFNADGSFSHTKTFIRDDVDRLIEDVTNREVLKKLEDIASEKDRFIRIIFHELRTPLNVLSLSISTLMDASSTPKAAGVSSSIVELKHQMDKCMGMVEDLSFVMMFDSDNVVLPRPMVHNLRQDLQSIFQVLGIVCNNPYSPEDEHFVQQTVANCRFRMLISDDVPCELLYDKSLLRVFFNLLSNAVKYCEKGGSVELSVSYAIDGTSPLSHSKDQPDAVVRAHTEQQQQQQQQNECGVLRVSVKNSVRQPLDLVKINKSFQKYLRMLPSGTGGGGGGGGGHGTNSGASSSRNPFGSTDSESGKSRCFAVEGPALGTAAAPVLLLDEHTKKASRTTEELLSSLISSHGLGLGLYVSYNILQSLGGLLECSTSESEACFWFSIPVICHSHNSAHSSPGTAAAMVSAVRSSPLAKSSYHSPDSSPPADLFVASEEPPASTYIKLEELWAHVTKSEASSKHVIGLRQKVQNAKFASLSAPHSATPSESFGGITVSSTSVITSSSSNSNSTNRTDTLLESSSLGALRSSPKSTSVTVGVNKLGRILVVDDSPICRKVLIRALEANNYTTDFACDGQEACEKMSHIPCVYSAVLMDLRMPLMDGITATKLIKAMPHASRVPIIVVTAEMGEEIRVAAMEAKADRFLNKPVMVTELLLLLQEYSAKRATESTGKTPKATPTHYQSRYDDEERIQHEDDIFTLCAAVEEYKEQVELLQRDVLQLSTRNNQLEAQNEALVAREIEHVSNINALEEAMSNLLEELNTTAKQLQARDDDIESLQACLNAVHRRKIDVDDLTKQQQTDLIEKLQIENQLLKSSKKSNKDLVAHYDEIVNDKNSEILDLKDRIRELEAEKREYLNSFKKVEGNGTGYSTDEEKATELKRATPPRPKAKATQPASSGSYKDKIGMLSDYGSSLLSSVSSVSSKPSVPTKKEPYGRHSELHSEQTSPDTLSTFASGSTAAPGSGVKLREITVDSSTAATYDKYLPTLTANPVRRTPPRKNQHHNQHRHQQLNSSYSEDEYRSPGRKQLDRISSGGRGDVSSGAQHYRHSRSAAAAFSSADDYDDCNQDGESDDMKSPVELTIRKATNAIRNNKKNRQDSQRRAFTGVNSTPPEKQPDWQSVNKHADLFREVKVVKKSNNQSDDEFENMVIPFKTAAAAGAVRKNSNSLLVNTFVVDSSSGGGGGGGGGSDDPMRSGAGASKYTHK